MKDWPASLKSNVATIDLAAALYTAQVAVYGGADWSWSGLQPGTKALYVQLAERILQGLSPGPRTGQLFDVAANLAREHAAQVIGRIAPAEPWGIGVSD